MILDMVVWGFFSAWGWIGANAIKETIWPDKPPAIEQPVKQKEKDEKNN